VLEVHDWPDDLRTSADALLYTATRDLLNNVIKHAQARSVTVTLGLAGGLVRLAIADDGKGVPDGAVGRSLGHGHIGWSPTRCESRRPAAPSRSARPSRPGPW
jgi:two-component system, NarL family, sensor kinase